MSAPSRIRRVLRCSVGVGALLVTLSPPDARAADSSALSLKAAFVFNFVKFVEWPTDAPASGMALRVCVANEPDVARELTAIVGTQQIGGRSVQVLRTTVDTVLAQCQLLYVGATSLNNARKATEPLKAQPVLTVSDTLGFAEAGGMIELYVEDGRMRFAINLAAARRAHLVVSSRILALARAVEERR
jgi:hypothetical protein